MTAFGFTDVLSVEAIVNDLLRMENEPYRKFLVERLDWCEELFAALRGVRRWFTRRLLRSMSGGPGWRRIVSPPSAGSLAFTDIRQLRAWNCARYRFWQLPVQLPFS
jgi:hypothetical protein